MEYESVVNFFGLPAKSYFSLSNKDKEAKKA